MTQCLRHTLEYSSAILGPYHVLTFFLGIVLIFVRGVGQFLAVYGKDNIELFVHVWPYLFANLMFLSVFIVFMNKVIK